MMSADTARAEWNRQRCKGYIQTWVARPKQPLRTVAAAIATICQKHSIAPSAISAIIEEVREGSVSSFFGPPFYSGPERLGRLNELVDELRRRGVL
jgi:hypothetical protein